jgi:hypothetical protein
MKREVLNKPLVRAENLVDLGVELPEVPVAVDLGARAIALADIMAYLNTANRVAGSRKQIGGKGKMTLRYGERAADIQAGAERNRDGLRSGFQSGIGTLAAVDALRANGMDEADIEVERVSLQAAINRQFGVGKANAADRAKVVRKAKKAVGN